ncbi:hypothetical protein [Planctomyces sp. SH-PL62]|uniref:hypothetical protein n=1 Tax=Planctomyces sp. SH-PL62 TaxID=1636152 RepID=UPI00078B995D|nr:hypothetical protein [Planctomyces sp. SH-PL62]AMV38152.1 hypothetical protein VT85_11990 [Planctomyces sp. SH-PL62]
MIVSRKARAAHWLLGTFLLGALAAGCDNSTGTAPVQTEAEIKAQQDREMEARRKAYGGRGVPTGKNPNKAAGKAAEKPAEPAEKPADAAEKAAP